MFGFFRASKKVKSEIELAEEKLLSDMRNALAEEGETPNTTILKSRVRIIDLEDKVTKIEKQIRNLRQTLCVRKYRKKVK
jgi:polyhydroxyalkanoate synthesis regulator phasin